MKKYCKNLFAAGGILFCCCFNHLFGENINKIRSDELFYPSFNGWKQAETQHFRFIYEDASKESAAGFALIADDAWNKIAKIYSIPQDKSDIYVTGRTNTVNALTYFCPLHIELFTTPVISPTFTFREDWKKLFFTHELIHLANSSFEDRTDAKILKKAIGPFAGNLDFIDVNGWALEGLTTVLETELTNAGRGRSPYYELMYKAPTIDNSFISYNEIGLEEEPPHGQNYVMGYLIMRSIADNYGIQALADIERNRSILGSWEDCVYLVTGKSARDIYADVKIALAKKYCRERTIPEGQIISSRDIDTNYYNPLIVFNDGTLLCLRSSADKDSAVVKLDPSAINGSSYLEDTHPETDLNSVYQETILFSTGFPTSDCATADENETVYTTQYKTRNDKNPGVQVVYPLYKWTKEDGLKQLTKDLTFFQPSVSRNGKYLAAVQQKDLQMRIVSIDLVDGTVQSLLEDENLSFIQPSVNDDGTKIAFLVLDGKRAKVAVADVSSPYNYKIVANNDENLIYDPAYPHWNSNGNLTFTCNYRGRLEIFEVTNSSDPGTNTDSTTNTNITDSVYQTLIKPVVSDPTGVLWAYECEKGIIYSSYASTGYVLKILPLSQWGQTPDFDGPSKAGQIICFGNLMNDFPDFDPYPQLSQIEETDDESSENFDSNNDSETKPVKTSKTKENQIPIPVKGKTIKHRSKENSEFAENSNSVQTVLQNEKSFLQLPEPVLYVPVVDFLHNYTDNSFSTGFGAAIIATSPFLQRKIGFYEANIQYFPEFDNLSGSVNIYVPSGKLEMGIFFNRVLSTTQITQKQAENLDSEIPLNLDSLSYFTEKNSLKIGFSFPIISKAEFKNNLKIDFASSINGETVRYNQNICSISDSQLTDFSYSVYSNLGFDFYLNRTLKKQNRIEISSSVFTYSYYDFNKKHIFFGEEGDASLTFKTSGLHYLLGVKGRYFPFSQEKVINTLSNKYCGTYLNCFYPAAVIPQIALILPDYFTKQFNLKFYAETLFKGSAENIFCFDDSFGLGAEVIYNYENYYIAGGTTYKFSIIDDDLNNFTVEKLNFYISVKFNFERL